MATTGEVKVEIIRAERLRIPKVLDSGRLEKLRAFKMRITDWAKPSLEVEDKPVIVTLKKGSVKRTFDHFHTDVLRFEELIRRKREAEYEVHVKDGVKAYLLVFKRGSCHLIAGFLSSKYDDGTPAFPEWGGYVSPETVGQALSRLVEEGWVGAVITPEQFKEWLVATYGPITKYPPRLPPKEKYYGEK